MNTYSPSKIGCWNQCKFLFKQKYIDKVKFPFIPTKHLEKGNYIHNILDSYPKAPQNPFKFNISTKSQVSEYKELLRSILKRDVVRDLLTQDHAKEQTFFITEDWGFTTGYKGSILNGKVDYFNTNNGIGTIIDWKTGKFREGAYRHQLEVYAIFIFLKYPSINKVNASLYYVDHDIMDNMVYTRDELQGLKDKFIDLINTIENETEFAKTPGPLCDWCDAQKAGKCNPFSINNLTKERNGRN